MPVDAPQIVQTNLVLRPRPGSGEKVYWDAQWRFRVAGVRAVAAEEAAARQGVARA